LKRKPKNKAKNNVAKRSKKKAADNIKKPNYRPYVKKHRPSTNYQLYLHYVSDYVRSNPGLVDYKKYGGFSKFAGSLWADIKDVPIGEIERNIDIYVKDKVRKRKIELPEFKNEYDFARWFDATRDIFDPILNEKHVIVGDTVIFDGEKFLNTFIFDISKPESWAKKTQILHLMLSRLIRHHFSSDDIPTVAIDDIKVDEKGNWEITYRLQLSDKAREELELNEREDIFLSESEMDELDIKSYERELIEKQKITKKQIEEEKERKALEKEEAKKIKEEGIEPIEVQIEKAKQKTIESYKKAGLTPEQIAAIEIEREKTEREKEKEKQETIRQAIKAGWKLDDIQKLFKQ
jgi:hypothetical protein